MTISENAETFYKCRVKDFTGPDDWEGPKLAYRLRRSWDDEEKRFADVFEHILQRVE